MPVGRGFPPSASGSSIIPGTVAEGEIGANAAVALVTNGSGDSCLVECSAMYHGDKFYGFARRSALSGQKVEVKTMRGSPITPLVEGGFPLTVGSPVFLSRTPGHVSDSVPAEYEYGAYGIEYAGGSASQPSTYTNPSGSVPSTKSLVGYQVPGGVSCVFRALFKSPTNGNIKFRVSGNDTRMWWNIQARPATVDLDPIKAAVIIPPGTPGTGESALYPISEGVTTPFVLAGGEGSLTLEWSINGGPWESDGSHIWLQYMTDTQVRKPVTIQVGYATSPSEIVLITDLRVV